MKSIFDVFNEGFEEITRMVGQGNYKGSFVYSSNLTLFSTLLDYEDGILISELLRPGSSRKTELPGGLCVGHPGNPPRGTAGRRREKA